MRNLILILILSAGCAIAPKLTQEGAAVEVLGGHPPDASCVVVRQLDNCGKCGKSRSPASTPAKSRTANRISCVNNLRNQTAQAGGNTLQITSVVDSCINCISLQGNALTCGGD